MIKRFILLPGLLLIIQFSQAIFADEETDIVAAESQREQASDDVHSATSNVGFATNASGQLDQPPAVDEKQPVWGHKLPIFAQKVLDMGFELPEPYGVTGVFVHLQQEVSLSNLRISFGDPNQPQTAIPFVTFQPSTIETDAWNLKLDMWLFPFLNTFIIGNHLKGDGLIPIVVPGEDILKVLAPPIGARCDDPPGHPLRPPLCDEDVVLLDEPRYTGETIGVGVVLPIGWRNFFAAIPMSYTWTDTSNSSGLVKTFQGSFRMGYHFTPKKTGQLALYVGTTYLDSEQDVFGVFEVDTDIPELGTIDINYTIHQTPADKWNYLAGFNWVITKNWWLQAEIGFGGKRDNFIASLNYRW